jgi:plasmid stabilization system protein ParE
LIFRRLPAADLEIFEAAEWYDNQRPRLGDDFTEEVENAFDRICRDPLLYPRVEHFSARDDVRRCLLHRFPYLVIYRHRPDEILVAAVSHVRRKPYYWLERLA